jgi:F-type H+-transporting ATPase subunit gamma
MSESREELARRIQSAKDLRSITGAMEALAAIRIRQSKKAVDSIEAYAETVEMGLQIALMKRPGGLALRDGNSTGPTGAVVFGSDLGLVGRYNLRIVDYAIRRVRGETDAPASSVHWVTVGERVGVLLDEAGQEISSRLNAPHSVDEINHLTEDLVVVLEQLRSAQDLGRIVLFYNHHHIGAVFRPSMVHLYPLNESWLRSVADRPWDSRCLPTFRGTWSSLFSEIVREHLFVTVFRAAAESQASEYASRLNAMQEAKRQIDESLDALRGRFGQRRKQEITEELLDLLSGYSAIMDPPDGDGL